MTELENRKNVKKKTPNMKHQIDPDLYKMELRRTVIVAFSPRQMSDCSAVMNGGVKTRESKVPVVTARHVARIVSLGAASVLGGANIFRVLLYFYSLLAMSAVSVTEYTNN